MIIENENEVTDANVIESRIYLEYIGKVQKINEYRASLGIDLITEIKTEATTSDLTQITKEFEFIKNKFRAHGILIKVQQKIMNFNLQKAQQSH